MKHMIIILLLAVQGVYASDERLALELFVYPKDWRAPAEKENFPLLFAWEIKNMTSQRLTLPIGYPAQIILVDADGKGVPGGEIRDSTAQVSYKDYKEIQPGWSTYISPGELSLYYEKRKLYLGGPSPRGGRIRYGPLTTGKYKLKCVFVTNALGFDEPSEYSQQKGFSKDLWLGRLTSPWISIEIK